MHPIISSYSLYICRFRAAKETSVCWGSSATVCRQVCIVYVFGSSFSTAQYVINTLTRAHSHRNVNTCSNLMHYACVHLCLTSTVWSVFFLEGQYGWDYVFDKSRGSCRVLHWTESLRSTRHRLLCLTKPWVTAEQITIIWLLLC